jgi:hypothetical protein
MPVLVEVDFSPESTASTTTSSLKYISKKRAGRKIFPSWKAYETWN